MTLSLTVLLPEDASRMADDFGDEEGQLLMDDTSEQNGSSPWPVDEPRSEPASRLGSHTTMGCRGKSISPMASRADSRKSNKEGENGHPNKRIEPISTPSTPSRNPTPRKRRKEETVPKSKSATQSPVADVEPEVDKPSKKRKNVPPKTEKATNKHCQTDDSLGEMEPDGSVYLKVTFVFASDPGTLYFTTRWRGRDYHGIITDGLRPKYRLFARKKERAERRLKLRAKRAMINRVLEEKSESSADERNASSDEEECAPKRKLVFDVFDHQDYLHVPAAGGPDAKPELYIRCPHQQCGRVFQSIDNVNNHIVFNHVSERKIIKENVACQCDPEDLQQTEKSSSNKPRSTESKSKTRRSPTPSPFSDISDDAPTLIKEESFDKTDDARKMIAKPDPDAGSPRPSVSGLNDANSKTKTPDTTPNRAKNVEVKHSPQPFYPNLALGAQFSPFGVTPAAFNTQQKPPLGQQLAAQQFLLGAMQQMHMPTHPALPPQIKAGGSLTSGSPLATVTQSHPSTAQLANLANGMAGTPPDGNPLRHKIHELKADDAVGQRASPTTASTIIASANSLNRTLPQMNRLPAPGIPGVAQLPFFQRMPNMQQPYANPQVMQHLAALMNQGSMLPQQPK